jgi:hypothetical protein
MTIFPFGIFRLVIVSLAVCAQVYLFLRIRRAIRSSSGPGKRSLIGVLLAGAAIGVLFAANWHIMYKPIPWLDPPAAAQAILFYLPAVWAFGSIISALVLLLQQALGGAGRAAGWIFRRPGAGKPAAGMDAGRRRFLKTGIGGLAAAPFMLSGYGATAAIRDPMVAELALSFGCPLRVVQLTDIHAGIFMTRETMRRYVDRVIALKPELFVLTGDYISNSTVFFPGFAEEMARVRAPLGTFATMGNHEHWHGDLGFYRDILEKNGIELLQNEHRVIGGPRGVFALAGIDDLRWGRPDLEAALEGLDPGLPVLLLSHRPEIFPEAAERGVALTLAGHYHGGQVKVRIFGEDFSLAHLRTPYPEGLYRIGGSRLYVSRGIGTTFTPVRLNAPPEVTLLRLA